MCHFYNVISSCINNLRKIPHHSSPEELTEPLHRKLINIGPVDDVFSQDSKSIRAISYIPSETTNCLLYVRYSVIRKTSQLKPLQIITLVRLHDLRLALPLLCRKKEIDSSLVCRLPLFSMPAPTDTSRSEPLFMMRNPKDSICKNTNQKLVKVYSDSDSCSYPARLEILKRNS